jgi:hypothetical protein
MKKYHRKQSWQDIDYLGDSPAKTDDRIRITDKEGNRTNTRVYIIRDYSYQEIEQGGGTVTIKVRRAMCRYKGLKVQLLDLHRDGYKIEGFNN